jgi:cyanophycin synthetase
MNRNSAVASRLQAGGVILGTIRALRGPNVHAVCPVLVGEIHVGIYEDLPSSGFPGLRERLTSWLPGLSRHECSVGRPGGFLERIRRGTYLAHIVEHVGLELQNHVGFDVSFGRARGAGRRGVYRIVMEYQEEEPALAALRFAPSLAVAAMHADPFDASAGIEALRKVADEHRLGPSTQAIVEAARRRGIPVVRLTPRRSLVQLGYGVHQKRIQASETSLTSSIAVEVCQEKPLTNRMLSTVGVPIPPGRLVPDAGEAWQAACDIGLPVVVKPADGNQGRGVSVRLRAEQEVRDAFHLARRHGEVLVERCLDGDDYRLLVVNGVMVAAARRDPPCVIGDGRRSVRELVAEINRDPRRRAGHSAVLTEIPLDEVARMALAQQRLDPETVPAAGARVALRSNGNLSTGGTAADVTAEVHPANAQLAELAAQVLALDVAGVDLICRDIRRPLHEQDGAVVEVNAAPGLRMHLHPSSGQPRDVASPIVEMLYPEGSPSRIPIVAVTGTNGKTTVTRLIAHLHETGHKVVGMTTTEGTWIDGRRVLEGDCSGPRSARAVLLHPRVEIAVLETARGGIMREGLGFDRCRVGVVTTLSADHLGQDGIATLEELALVKQVVVEAVERGGSAVLSAEEPLVAEMAAATRARVIYFAHDGDHPVIRAHRQSGGWSVYVRDGSITLDEAGQAVPLVALDRLGFTGRGAVRFEVSNALAAVAAGWGCGLNPALVVRALTTFDTSMVPGRFNLLELHGVQVVLDYGHNAAAMRALGQALESLGPRRTTMVLGLPGDRRDADLLATFDETVPFVNRYVIHDLLDRRGRAPCEVPEMLAARVPAETPCTLATAQREAIQQAWTALRPGERLVVIADVVEETLDTLAALGAEGRPDGACQSPVAPRGMRAMA